MSESKTNNWYPAPESTKLSTELYDSKAGTYKVEQLEGKQVAPKHDPSPFTAGGNTPKEQ